ARHPEGARSASRAEGGGPPADGRRRASPPRDRPRRRAHTRSRSRRGPERRVASGRAEDVELHEAILAAPLPWAPPQGSGEERTGESEGVVSAVLAARIDGPAGHLRRAPLGDHPAQPGRVELGRLAAGDHRAAPTTDAPGEP